MRWCGRIIAEGRSEFFAPPTPGRIHAELFEPNFSVADVRINSDVKEACRPPPTTVAVDTSMGRLDCCLFWTLKLPRFAFDFSLLDPFSRCRSAPTAAVAVARVAGSIPAVKPCWRQRSGTGRPASCRLQWTTKS